MSTLKDQFQKWKEQTTQEKLVLIEANDEKGLITFTVDDKLFKVSCPKTKSAIYVVDSDEKGLNDVVTSCNSFALDRAGELSLNKFLDKCLHFYNKAKAPKSEEAEEDLWGDGGDGEGGEEDEDGEKDEEGGGGDDWGDLADGDKSMVAAVTGTGDDEWNKWHKLKKKWEAKEKELRQKPIKVDEKKAEKQIFSSQAASKILTNRLIELMKDKKSGIEVEPVEDNIYTWRVRMTKFDSTSQLYTDLMKLKASYGYGYVELEFKFPMDLYPFYPPSVRLVRPRLHNFLMGRIVCMEEIQVSKWNPVREIGDILESITRLLTSHGSVDDRNSVNDPSNSLPPYTALEFQLLRLSMLTEVTPRIVYTMKDRDQKTLVVPKEKKKKTETSAASSSSAVTSSASSSSSKPTYWAKGTGYGHGSSHSEDSWNPEAFLAAQRKKELEIEEICDEVLVELSKDKIPPGLKEVIEQSCILPFLEQYIKNDSLTDINSRHQFYGVLFNICIQMAIHTDLASVFTLPPLPGQTKTLADYVQELWGQAKIADKLAKSTGTSGKDTEAEVLKLIIQMGELVDAAVKRVQKESKSKSSTEELKHTDKKLKTDSKFDSVLYGKLMSELKFDEISEFKAHHYWKEASTVQSVSRQWSRRLATEYSDLSKSLPINPDSSVFLRHHDSKMAFCQIMISAPVDTPYSRGCFLFDVFFPSTYPNTSPKVNLQTTGNGTVRFNPNLYHCGKVCLSLLGTWSGSKNENWNPATSTFLQVAVSIQSLIMVPKPYFNEPSYERTMGTPEGERQSDAYNEEKRIGTVRFAMIDMIKNPPPGFEQVVRTHFYLQKDLVLEQVNQWATTNSTIKGLVPQLKECLNSIPRPKKLDA